MGRIIYIIAMVFLIIWFIGVFFYSIGAIAYLFLLLAFITIGARIIYRRVFIRNRRSGKDVSI